MQPQSPHNILSLDGGGIRGLSSLFILQDLMDDIQRKEGLSEQPRPCDYFHLIVGTSTGGFIALMLGRLKMRVDEAIAAYNTLSNDVFGKSTGFTIKFWSSDPRYSSTVLEDAILRIPLDPPRNLAKTPLTDPDPDPKCKVAVVAVQERTAGAFPELLRTYKSGPGSYHCTVVEAARATSAAPTFFPPATIEVKPGLSITYIDGGVGHNNPTALALQEARKIWGDNCMFSSVVSIGTGLTNNIHFTGSKLRLAKRLEEIATNCQGVHASVGHDFAERSDVYFRFNVPTDLRSIGLDEWKKKAEVGELTHAYIRDNPGIFQSCVRAIMSAFPHSFTQEAELRIT